jgi:hypothetical protein|tara:strand:- start:1002 stop:1343 length:342 start_codon:yes stop_codon:yes gene_type:complete
MSRKKQLDSLLEGLDPGSEKYEELKALLDAENFQAGNLTDDEIDFIEQSGKKLMADGGMAVRPTNKQVRKFANGGALMGQMRARDNRADMEAGGMVSRGGRMSRQGVKFRGVK